MSDTYRCGAKARLALGVALLATVGAVQQSCACDAFTDQRQVYLITDWTLNPVTCGVEGEDIRDERVATHLIFNPLGQTGDQEAIVSTCLLDEGSATPCAFAADDVDFGSELSLRMTRGANESWVTDRIVHTSDGACTGYIEEAELTFPVAQRFRLELRRSKFDVPNPSDCMNEGPAQARSRGCTELEVLHGDFEIELTAPYESSSSGGGGD